jgi:hypothetical protein
MNSAGLRHPTICLRQFGLLHSARRSCGGAAFGCDHVDALGGVAGYPDRGDFVPGYQASVWFGVGAPKNTPTEIVDTLNKEINAALADPKMKAQLAELGGTVLPGTPADFGKMIADETEKWGKVVKFTGIKAD